MNKSDFFYDLPENLIAQHPMEPRDHSRMMVLSKDNDSILHQHFYDVTDYFNEGDCIILNNTRVLPARIYGTKKETGAVVEFLLLNQIENDLWETLAGPGKRAKEGTEFTFGDGILNCKVEEVLDNGNRIIRFTYDKKDNIFNNAMLSPYSVEVGAKYKIFIILLIKTLLQFLLEVKERLSL